MDEEKIIALRLELWLYKQYVDVLEHLHVFNGGLLLDDKKYNKEWLKRGNRTWLNDQREYFAQRLEELKQIQRKA
jgi:hypothetical protein